eukprot:jgi/Chlat1/5365/Chrsp35S05286
MFSSKDVDLMRLKAACSVESALSHNGNIPVGIAPWYSMVTGLRIHLVVSTPHHCYRGAGLSIHRAQCGGCYISLVSGGQLPVCRHPVMHEAMDISPWQQSWRQWGVRTCPC